LPHSPLFDSIRNALAQARLQAGEAAPAQRAISRRAALAMMAAVAACAPRQASKAVRDRGPIAIIGGGLAGLVTAWRLALSGLDVTLYESSKRIGGRVYTLRDFTPEGQFAEYGGEFVSSHHTALIGLCDELGVALQRLRAEGDAAADLYDFEGAAYSGHDLLDSGPTGLFLPAAVRIAADQSDLLDADGAWTARARTLDAMPLSAYLASLRPSVEPWVIDLLGLAFQTQSGLPPDQQSALNLVDCIGADPAAPFALFGPGGRTQRIAGGSSSLPETLVARLADAPLVDRATLRLHHELTAIKRDGDAIHMSFATPEGPIEGAYARVILTLPFTRLRTVKGLGGLGLGADKMRAINELGYGDAAKLLVATRSRPWRDGAIDGLDGPFSGAIWSDRGFQSLWNASIGQEGKGGVLASQLGGAAARGEETPALQAMLKGVRALSPALADAMTPELRASFFWSQHPHTRGGASAARPGQYTSLFEHAATPELAGALLFAGEHASADSHGTMNGAVASAEAAVRTVLSSG
jgi:monoamine oxidase